MHQHNCANHLFLIERHFTTWKLIGYFKSILVLKESVYAKSICALNSNQQKKAVDINTRDVFLANMPLSCHLSMPFLASPYACLSGLLEMGFIHINFICYLIFSADVHGCTCALPHSFFAFFASVESLSRVIRLHWWL